MLPARAEFRTPGGAANASGVPARAEPRTPGGDHPSGEVQYSKVTDEPSLPLLPEPKSRANC